MFCNALGNPDPNGNFELKDGNLILRDGGRIHYSSPLFRDAAPGQTSVYLTDGAIQITDSDLRAYEATDEGKGIAALASTRGLAAARWGVPTTKADIDNALLDALVAKRRAESAYAEMVADLANAHRRNFEDAQLVEMARHARHS